MVGMRDRVRVRVKVKVKRGLKVGLISIKISDLNRGCVTRECVMRECVMRGCVMKGCDMRGCVVSRVLRERGGGGQGGLVKL